MKSVLDIQGSGDARLMLDVAQPVAALRDDFNFDTNSLIRSIMTLLEMDAAGALMPQRGGDQYRKLLSAAAARLAAVPPHEPGPKQPSRLVAQSTACFAELADHERSDAPSFQSRVQEWMLTCFGAAISADRNERNDRFYEEAGELAQARGMTREEAHVLVDYTWSRPVGEARQEVGGVMVTLAALCSANDLDMQAAGEAELARINVPSTIEKIRAKQAAKPKHSPLPAVSPSFVSPSDATDDLARVYAAFGIGEKARTINTLLVNIGNATRRSDCLWGIEKLFRYEVPADDCPGETIEECDLKWGQAPAEYVETFKAALPAFIARRPELALQQTLPAGARDEDAHVAKRMWETLVTVYATIVGDDRVDVDDGLNAIQRLERVAQVLRFEVELLRAQAAGLIETGSGDTTSHPMHVTGEDATSTVRGQS
ncbi:hypothetical protein [Burkholderia cepacia]|uniref:hypothetical protein n=1 Tax=Burkholderia cepacia TaxID=292 RepID=UPI0007C87908|nr:hypothetical protein [Burkholderia cepacia]